MRASVIIPVWNGETVIADCLHAVYRHSGTLLLEVICVDNASSDSSATVISEHFPQARLLPQPVNLGFAGGANQGIRAAGGNIFVLLNQDCLVQEDWLAPIVRTFVDNAENGILGGTLFNADGSINHVGAYVRIPDAWGIHHTTLPASRSSAPREVEYVTGALFAIRRAVWDNVGPLDEGFYPAYYEEADYCYRARKHGFRILHVPGARATHYFSSREWRKKPIKHATIQHYARYRFVAKHFGSAQLAEFVTVEETAIADERYLNQVLGALLGARDVLAELPSIEAARQRDLGTMPDSVRARLLEAYFGRLLNLAYTTAQQLIGGTSELSQLAASRKTLAALEEEKNGVLEQIYFRHPQDMAPETWVHRWWRLFVLRGLSILVLRDYRLFARLATLQAAHLAEFRRHTELIEQETEDRVRLLNLLLSPAFYEFP